MFHHSNRELRSTHQYLENIEQAEVCHCWRRKLVHKTSFIYLRMRKTQWKLDVSCGHKCVCLLSTCLTVNACVPSQAATCVAIEHVSACSTIQTGSWKALINVWNEKKKLFLCRQHKTRRDVSNSTATVCSTGKTSMEKCVYLSHSGFQCTQEHIHKCSHWPNQCMFHHSSRELKGTHQCLENRTTVHTMSFEIHVLLLVKNTK